MRKLLLLLSLCVLAMGQGKEAKTKTLSAEAFTYLLVNNQPSVESCHKWIVAATSLSGDESLRLTHWAMSATPDYLRDCVTSFPALSLADVRKAAVAIFRFEQDMRVEATIESGNLRKQLADAKQAKEEAEAHYNGLNTLYKGLQADYAQAVKERDSMADTANKYSASYKTAVTECLTSISGSFNDGIRQGQQYCATSKPINCRSELVGWTIQTVCK